MEHQTLIGLAAIAVLGIGAQWLAWRLKLPSILLLLIFGFIAGPVAHWVDPDALMGDLLFPLVSISVGLILFEGGMSLNLKELKTHGGTVRNLVTIGAVVTWVAATLAAVYILGMELRAALVLGAIMVVTGPTVVGPLLRHVRPSAQLGGILKWEGIVIDPIGAMLATIVYEAVVVTEAGGPAHHAVVAVVRTVLIGGAIGAGAALALVQVLKRRWVPDFLHNPVTLALVIGCFAASNVFQEESGLFAVTLMGLMLANQRKVDVGHIFEFKENLRVLLISGLFILLAARLDPADLRRAGWPAVGYLLALLFIVRPAMVAVSTAGSKLTWRERALLAWIAPRGIVAAAVASVFALRLADTGGAGADLLVPVTFMVIIGTVAVYGLTAAPLARRLGVAQEDPQGFLILGANQLARALGKEIQSHGLPVRLIDTNWSQVTAARMEGLPATYGSILSEKVQEEIDLAGIGRMLALTPNDEINALAAIHYAEIFGRHRVFQIMPRKGDSSPRTAVSRELTGRRVFGPGTTYAELNRRLNAGAELKNTQLTEDFTYRDFAERYGESAVPLIVISGEKKLRLFTEDDPPKLKSGNRLVSLVKEKPEPPPRDEAKKD